MYSTFKHLQLFKISSDLSKNHLNLSSLPLSSSPYQIIFSYSSPSIQNQLSQTPSGSYKKFIQHSKTTTLTYTTFKHLQLFNISSDLSQTHPKLTSLHLFSSIYKNVVSYSSPSIQNPLSQTSREPIEKLTQDPKPTTLTCHFQTSITYSF